MMHSVEWRIRPGSMSDGEPPSPRGFTFVCDAGRPVGHARVLESDGFFHLVDVAVEPDWRRRGIGRALVSAVETEVISRGATALTLLTAEEADFFSRLGYDETDRLPVALRWLDTPGHRSMGRALADPVVPRPAVSVIPLRDGPSGLEVFAQHRVGTMDFAAGAVVFPGGRVDPPDFEQRLELPPHLTDAWTGTALPPAEALVAAGIREISEECDVLLAPTDLIPWDNWVTPPGGRRRFDVAFFLTHVRDEDAPRWANSSTESLRSSWDRVTTLLADEKAGRIRLLPPTLALLTELAEFTSAADVLTYAPPILPVLDDSSVRPRPSGAYRRPRPR